MAELLPSELPLIIKKELIKAEDRINKTRTPNVDQDVVGGMPTDKTDSTSIGETILDILCSLRFLSENKIAVQKIVDAISESPDSTKVASEVLASVIDKKAVKAQNTANTAVTNAKTADDKAVKAQNTANTAVANAKTAQSRADSAYSLADSKWSPQTTSGTGTIIRKSITDGHSTRITTAQNRADSAYALAEKKIDKTSIANTLGNSTTLVASQKLVSDIDKKMLGVDQKWINVTSERSPSTIYTNSNVKPMFIMISGKIPPQSTILAEIYVDDVITGRIGAGTSTCSALVPRNSKYYIKSSNFQDLFWSELR